MEGFQGGSDAAPASRHEMRFEGSGGEYFKIWIVNLALSIVTLGIFSAWAKVRNKRYFLGNTFLDGHSFDYHGDPKRILLGRVIALGLLLAYYITAATAPLLVLVWFVAFLFAVPWLVRASFRFNARNTSFRNIRFDFHGTYGGAFKAVIGWQLLTAVTLFTLLPLAHRARDYYRINNHSFGGKNFEAEIPAGKLYLIYLLGLAILVVGAVCAYTVYSHSGINLDELPKRGEPPSPVMIGAFMMISVVYVATLLFMAVFLGTMTFNLAVNSTRLGETLQLESDLSPFAMVWIALSNLILILITLGLFSPWAQVRVRRYFADHLAVTGPASMDGFVASAAEAGSAVGEELAGFFDFDFGL